MLTVCWVAALVACLGYGIASVLQSQGARSVAPVESGIRLAGVAAIWLQAQYLLGLGLDGVAFVANTVALQRLPLYLVQALVSGSVGVTALVARWRGVRMNRWQWSAVGVLAIGLVLLSISAGPESAVPLQVTAQWLLLVVGVIPLGLGVGALRLRGPARPVAVALASGLAYTGVAVAARALIVPDPWWHLLASPLLWAIVLHGILGTALFAVALQHGSVTAVTAITFVVELIVPAAVGLVWLGDSVAHGLVVPAALGFAVTIVATVVLGRFAA